MSNTKLKPDKCEKCYKTSKPKDTVKAENNLLSVSETERNYKSSSLQSREKTPRVSWKPMDYQLLLKAPPPCEPERMRQEKPPMKEVILLKLLPTANSREHVEE